MDSRASLASQESTNQTKKMSRKRPLRTCAVSVLMIANQACTRVQGIHGPLGTVAKVVAKFATFASPIIILMRYQWIIMVLFSFVDYIILAVENVIERLYPPSNIVFNKIDDLVQVVETLPQKLDQAMNKLPSSIHPGSVLDWGLFRAITMLNFVSSTLTGWRMLKGAREKEIVVDTSCRNNNNNNHRHNTNEADGAKANGATEQLIESSSKHDAKGGEANNNKNMKSNRSTPSTTPPLGTPPHGAVMKGSYKEALTKGKKERSESKREENKYKKNGKEMKTKKEKHHSKKEEKSAAADVNNGGNSEDDEILDLFDSAWLMNRRRNFGKAPRSVSFHGVYY
ncbi:hypothetical protein ACLB2K_036948 [Fragaria x ananassa]